MKISCELDEMRKEKNLVGSQMLRRNDEIKLLKETLGIMQTVMDQSELASVFFLQILPTIKLL